MRQWQAAGRQIEAQAQELRNLVRGMEGIDGRDLEALLAQIKKLNDERIYKDPEELLRLNQELTERAKRFEFALRRQVSDQNAIALSGADEVPKGHETLVDNYFRSLSRPSR
jgi:hypothetical protein